MITPEDIVRKATNLYPAFLEAWLSGTAFFPRVIPSNKTLPDDLPTASRDIQALREGSKEVLGFGYSVEWREVRSRKHGKNLFPSRIFFETEADFLRTTGKAKDFQRFSSAVTRLRKDFPELVDWCRRHVREVVDQAESLDGLIEVLHYLRAHPRPQRFPRELPLSVDTKFIERHQKTLRPWLDLALPPHTIRADENHFERRFGLQYVEPHFFVRFIDDRLRDELAVPCDVLSVPVSTLAQWQFESVTVVIVENKTNLLTLPRIERGVALGGLGNGAVLFRDLPWLATNALLYWGDLDVQGFEILSRVRTHFPHTRSVMMDESTLARHRALAMPGTECSPCTPVPTLLTPEEALAFSICLKDNIRLEQERIPQLLVTEVFGLLSPLVVRTEAHVGTVLRSALA